MKYLQLAFLLVLSACSAQPSSESVVQPFAENPNYLAWGDVPVFPLGPANLHSWTPISRPGTSNFLAHMDRLHDIMEDIGSPHVRGFMRFLPYDPMNHLHDGPVERVLQPWVRLEDGRYDLSKFEPEWEERMVEYLDAALARQFIISMEIWDDWSVTRGPGGEYDPGEGAAWNAHPFNPKNNINYDEEMLPLETSVCNAPFYSTIPSIDHNELVLQLQKRYADRVLEIAAGYPNVLINITNESRAHLEWSRYWAKYIRTKVAAEVMIGEMPSTNRKDGGGECEHDFSPATLVTDPLYDFVDVAQGVSGHEFGSPKEQALGGGRRLNTYRQAMAAAAGPRPMLVSKDYTRDQEGGDMVLWSRFAGGAAAARFHRPGVQHGNEVIDFQHAAIERLGRFIAEIPFWNMHSAPELLQEQDKTLEANIMAGPAGHIVAQLFEVSEGQSFSFNLNPGTWTARWIDPATGEELRRNSLSTESRLLELHIPADRDHLVLHLQPNN
ncbi:MAG: hypothetical protein WDZ53_05575 [Balneolales bacterium]